MLLIPETRGFQLNLIAGPHELSCWISGWGCHVNGFEALHESQVHHGSGELSICDLLSIIYEIR